MEFVFCEFIELEFEYRRFREKDSLVVIVYFDKYILMYGDFFFFDWLSVFLKEKYFVRYKMWLKW